jgi:pimeloyl-ACP methyl ester carboxylesterase
MHRIEVDGLTIAYERAGSGPPLVLLHGGMSDSREWSRQIEPFSRDFTVLAWDAPGCGRSDDPPESFGPQDYARCLAGLVSALGLERPHLMGLSWGSGLALECCRWYPDLPASMVLVSAYAGWAGSLPPAEVERRRTLMIEQSYQPPESFVPDWIPTLLTESAPRELVDNLIAIMSDFHPAGTRTMVRAFAESDLRDVLPEVAVPVLLLYGEEDARSPLAVAREMHERIPGSTLSILPGAGHQCNLEAPEAFNAAALRFLLDHSDRRGVDALSGG